jgi:hypothetical protein
MKSRMGLGRALWPSHRVRFRLLASCQLLIPYGREPAQPVRAAEGATPSPEPLRRTDRTEQATSGKRGPGSPAEGENPPAG